MSEKQKYNKARAILKKALIDIGKLDYLVIVNDSNGTIESMVDEYKRISFMPMAEANKIKFNIK